MEHAVLESMEKYRDQELDAKINLMLERVELLRIVHEQSHQSLLKRMRMDHDDATYMYYSLIKNNNYCP
jgi:hypothetical protein